MFSASIIDREVPGRQKVDDGLKEMKRIIVYSWKRRFSFS